MEKLYTVGEAARLLSISPRKVTKLIDTNVLEGTRLPGSLHRRVSHSTILAFIEEYDLPLPPELRPTPHLSPAPTIHNNLPAQIRLLHSTLQTRLAYCSTDRDTITHLLQFRDNVMKAINDN